MAIKRNGIYFLLAAILISVFFQFQSPNIPDPDSLYHFRHAYLLRTNGIFNTEFPWTYYSAVRTYAADLWYGFHLLLLPLTYVSNGFLGVKISGVFLTALLLFSYYHTAVKQKLKWPAFWPFLFLLAIPNSLFQLLMVRPHLLSLIWGLLLFNFLINGSWRLIFLIGAGITFFHISFFWFGIGIAGLFLFLRIIQGGELLIGLKNFFLVIGGGVLGAILRPEPISALKLAYIQIVKLLVEKQSDLPLLFSRELAPWSFNALIQVSLIFFILWVAAVVLAFWFFYRYREQTARLSLENKLFLSASATLSLIFFLMTIFIARRTLMFWPAFGALFIGGAFAYLTPKKLQDNFSAAILILFLIMAPFTIYKNALDLRQNAMPPNHLREAAEWLKNNSQPEEIVFNTHWDNFSALFFWNQKNYYIGGMDPIFQYAYNPSLYWKFHHLSKDEYGDLTCGELECRPENLEDVYSVLKNDFQAKYVFIEKRRNPNFQRFLELDSRFEKKFDNQKEALFEIKG